MPTPSLLPSLSGRTLTVDAALNQPTIIRNRIAKLADQQILLPKLFHDLGSQVQGGGILFNAVKASDFYTSDIEQRSPGSEYKIVDGVDPDPQLATVADWGGRFQVTDEVVTRNQVNYLDQQTTQLANTIVKKLDVAAIANIEQALSLDPANTVVGHSWSGLVFVGSATSITASGNRPTADWAAAQLAADLQELGAVYNLLIVHPNQAAALRTAYAETLNDVLTSFGLELFVSPRMTAGVAYAVQKGEVGTVGFEKPLTVETYDDRAHRARWVQAYCVPAFAVDQPYRAKKITGLA